ncbi:MAG: hypothetical protein HUJ74_02165 [Lachnospiraceae bacterium]|nr:hypothetical protein [Lachnospiraceae bacterium]
MDRILIDNKAPVEMLSIKVMDEISETVWIITENYILDNAQLLAVSNVENSYYI